MINMHNIAYMQVINRLVWHLSYYFNFIVMHPDDFIDWAMCILNEYDEGDYDL